MPNSEPMPQVLLQRIHLLTHDLRMLRQNVAAGRVRPSEYSSIERALQSRLTLLEAEVHARLLDGSRRRLRAT